MSTDHHLPQTLILFFGELAISLSKAVNKFDNLIITGDFNLDKSKKDCTGFD